MKSVRVGTQNIAVQLWSVNVNAKTKFIRLIYFFPGTQLAKNGSEVFVIPIFEGLTVQFWSMIVPLIVHSYEFEIGLRRLRLVKYTGWQFIF